MSNNQEASIQKLNTLKNEYQMLSDKLSEMELELQEHQIVLEALIPLDPNRKSHRLIGGILVERTVEQVIPALKTNMEGVRLAIVDKNLTGKEGEILGIEKEFAASSKNVKA